MYNITVTKTIQQETPDVLPQSGEILVATIHFRTSAGTKYVPGDEFELLERTNEAPYGYLSSLGNWRVKCKARTSIWSSIESCMFDGWLVRKES